MLCALIVVTPQIALQVAALILGSLQVAALILGSLQVAGRIIGSLQVAALILGSCTCNLTACIKQSS